jgi:hypothetical protein
LRSTALEQSADGSLDVRQESPFPKFDLPEWKLTAPQNVEIPMKVPLTRYR